jgi:NAD+ kinase
MAKPFKNVALVGKYHTTAKAALEDVARLVASLGATVSLEQETALSTGLTQYPVVAIEDIRARCDLVLVLGGDGTMLGIARQLVHANVPLVGINHGRLGFITDIAIEDYRQALASILAGEFDEDSRALINAEVLRDGAVVFKATAMNDVVVNRGSTSGMVELRVEVDGRFVSNQRADGLIIATPTGSTAYSLSAGGPLLHPSVNAWVMVPIAPHTLSNRPIVLPDQSQIVIEVVSGKDASANFDMQSLAALLVGDRVVVQRAPHPVRFLHPKGWSYFDTLRRKLHWNEGGV